MIYSRLAGRKLFYLEVFKIHPLEEEEKYCRSQASAKASAVNLAPKLAV